MFFRCPYTEEINEFILKARELNKKVFYDVDDLVIDTEYTDQIPYLDTMPMEERKAYDDNVRNMGKLLKMCDAAITSTTHLQIELKKFVPEVLINRNTASEEMGCLSEKALRLKKSKSTVDIGYFSGSITHNDDFEMILPVIIEVMTSYQEVRLHLVGELDLPPELLEFQNRIIIHPFVDWKKLPELIAEVDINLAPLTDTLFNKERRCMRSIAVPDGRISVSGHPRDRRMYSRLLKRRRIRSCSITSIIRSMIDSGKKEDEAP